MLSCGPRELETRVVVGKTQSTRSRRLGVVGTSLVTCIPTQLRHLAHRRHLARRDTSSRQVSSAHLYGSNPHKSIYKWFSVISQDYGPEQDTSR
jgi:hypothetical protein